MAMTDDEIIEMVSGYVLGLEDAMRETGMTDTEIDELMLNNGYEACPTCGWYVELHERFPDDSDDPDDHCSNCRD